MQLEFFSSILINIVYFVTYQSGVVGVYLFAYCRDHMHILHIDTCYAY